MKTDIVFLEKKDAPISLNISQGENLVCIAEGAFPIELTLQEGARVEILRLVNARETSGVEQSFSLKVQQKKQSTLKSFFLAQGDVLAQDDILIVLEGIESRVELNGLCDLKGQARVKTQTLIQHRAENAQSHQVYKAVLDQKSVLQFAGRIFVDAMAQETQAYQLNQNILMTDEARVESKPELEIFADNVKCSHGSTTGQISQDELFYLQTRAIEKAQAQKMLIHGFMNDVIEKIENIKLRQRVIERFQA